MLKRPWLFLHVEFLKKYRLALKNSWRKFRKWLGAPVASTAPRVPVQPHTGLIVIGVDPHFQGKGYGAMLLAEFERQSMLRGYDLMMLTVRTDNHQAIRAYERSGWGAVETGLNSTTMEKQVNLPK
jgi:ribosomal protein S18 acetylase RimI-like enzyme